MGMGINLLLLLLLSPSMLCYAMQNPHQVPQKTSQNSTLRYRAMAHTSRLTSTRTNCDHSGRSSAAQGVWAAAGPAELELHSRAPVVRAVAAAAAGEGVGRAAREMEGGIRVGGLWEEGWSFVAVVAAGQERFR